MKDTVIKRFWILLIALICFTTFIPKSHGQQEDIFAIDDPEINTNNSILNSETANTAKQILILESPGKKGKEFKDTTIVVNTELTLYAALYDKGKYKSEAIADWFWADTSSIPVNPQDTSIYLGSGSSIIFKPKKAGVGFIFVKDLSGIPGDSTGTIKIIYTEKLIISPAYSDNATITQGQQNIPVSFQVENTGNFPITIQEANLQFIKAAFQIITNQYQVSRIDTTTLIQVGETRQFEFLVDAYSYADTGRVFINVQLMTGEAFYTDIEPKHQWQVQSPPLLNIDLIDAFAEEVFPGQDSIFVVMHVSNKGGASVNNINANLTFWHNSQDVSDEYEYVMSDNNPQFIKGDSSAQLTLIVGVKPLAAYGTIVINGKITARDVNTNITYSDEGADLQASWRVTQTLAPQVQIISTKINCPNSDIYGNGNVNVGQQYFVEAVVKNQGTEDLQRIGVSLSTDGSSRFLTNTSHVIPSLSKSQSDTVHYQLEANAAIIPILENFIAQIDSATSAGGVEAKRNRAVDSLAQVKITYPANLVLKLDTTFVQIPEGQTFDVKATVDHSLENAGFDSTGILSIRLPQGYQLISGNLFQPFKKNEKVIWNVRSPAAHVGLDTVLVYISQRPHDINNPDEYAEVTVDSAFLIVETLETIIEIADVAIIEPAGAIDGTISTYQAFKVRAKIKSQLVENDSIKITPPDSFTILDGDIKSLNADSVTWWLKAPDSSSLLGEQLIIQAWGNVEGDTVTVFSQPDSSLSVVTVSRANLKVSAAIIDPPTAIQGRISPGLSFKIKGEILNSGEAGVYGNQSLIIDVQDRNSFRVIDDTLLSVQTQPAIWTVQASENLDAIPKIIKIKIFDIPYDENTDEEAHIRAENQVADVQVFTTIINIQLMVRQLSGIASKAIAAGITANIMGIELANLSNEQGFPIQINALKFDIEDKAGNLIAPQSLISGFRIHSGGVVAGEATSILENPIEIRFTVPITLDAQETKEVMIEIDFHESLSQQFQINLKDSSYLEIESLFPVSIVDELKNPKAILNLRSHCPVITVNDLKRSFRNYPNPFGSPERKKAHFIYYLSQDADIELKIYTLIGELVWSCAYSSSDPQGKKGLHQKEDIVWDARNSRGYKVLNGVYIARIETSFGERAITKVAVIK